MGEEARVIKYQKLRIVRFIRTVQLLHSVEVALSPTTLLTVYSMQLSQKTAS